jgi:hypothetical protein
VTNPRVDDLDVNRHVAETGSRLHARLAEVSSQLRQSLEEDIPELRAGAGLLESVEKITGSDRTHLQASCSGGILAAMTAQHLTATGQGDRLASLTLMVTVLDQRKAGFAAAAIDEQAANIATALSARKGYLNNGVDQDHSRAGRSLRRSHG